MKKYTLSTILSFPLAIAAIALVVVGFLNVVLRNLSWYLSMQLTSNAYIELQIYLFNFIFLFGTVYTLYKNRHVRVDLLYTKFSPKTKMCVDIFGYLFFTIPFCLVILNYSLPWAIKSLSQNEYSLNPGGLPIYPLKLMLNIMLITLIIQSIYQCYAILSRYYTKNKGH